MVCIIFINEHCAVPLNSTISRKKRAPGIPPKAIEAVKNAATKLVKAGGKILMYTGILTGSTIAANELTRKFEEMRAPVYVERAQVLCERNDYGCAEKLCWSTCGPRMKATDWCWTGPPNDFNGQMIQTTVYNNDTKTTTDYTFVVCQKKSDCNPCWGCAGSCMMSSDAVMNADGTIRNSD